MLIGIICSILVLLCGEVGGIFYVKGDHNGMFVSLVIGVLLLFTSIESYETFWQGKIAKETWIEEGMRYETVKSVEVEGKTITFIRNLKENGELLVYEFAKKPPKFFVKTKDKENPYLVVQP